MLLSTVLVIVLETMKSNWPAEIVLLVAVTGNHIYLFSSTGLATWSNSWFLLPLRSVFAFSIEANAPKVVNVVPFSSKLLKNVFHLSQKPLMPSIALQLENMRECILVNVAGFEVWKSLFLYVSPEVRHQF